MAQRELSAAALAVAAVAAVVTALAASPASAAGGGLVTVASDRSAAEHYRRGFRDGLNGRDARDRDRDYRAGYQDGRARHESNLRRPDGREYARGFRDGYNGERADRGNRHYDAGYRDGQDERYAGGGGRPGTVSPPPYEPAPGSVEALVGRRDANLDRDMKSLGFERMSRFSKDGYTVSTWTQRGQSRCVRVTARRGKVEEVSNVDTDRCV